MLSAEQLAAIFPAASSAGVLLYLDPLNKSMSEFSIDTPIRISSFLPQIGVESGQLTSVEESLSYSAARLMAVWPYRFPNLSFAAQYARNPEKLANYVYAGRGGNGDEASGDGWRHRGAGLFQITFRDNQAACAAYFEIPFESIGDWLRTPEGAARSAGWFWQKNGLNTLADKSDQVGISGAINCGNAKAPQQRINGLAERLALFNRAKGVLKC